MCSSRDSGIWEGKEEGREWKGVLMKVLLSPPAEFPNLIARVKPREN
jgi:hypothetical protein